MSAAFKLPFVKKEKIAKDTYSFYFDRSKYDFNFVPGEYIRMSLNIKNPDDRGSSRYFTIASSPNNRKHLIVTTRVIKSAFKKKLYNLLPGDQIDFFGPLGNFIVEKKDKRPRVFLAGGIGVTTFYSMILYEGSTRFRSPITLIVSFSSAEYVIYRKEFEKIQAENPKLKVFYVLTNEEGRIDAEKIKKFVPNFSECVFYTVGPKEMEDALSKTVLSMGVSDENIKREEFPGY